ncbi:MAG: DinB family protein [Bacteroidota bacterium]
MIPISPNRLIEYDHRANTLILEALSGASDLLHYSDMVNLMGHILNTQKIWLNRITPIEGVRPVFDTYTWEEIGPLFEQSRDVLTRISDHLEQAVTYQNSKGQTYHNTGAEIFEHVIIHGQHHRAQIATRLREAGITPPGTDFIFFSRT